MLDNLWRVRNGSFQLCCPRITFSWKKKRRKERVWHVPIRRWRKRVSRIPRVKSWCPGTKARSKDNIAHCVLCIGTKFTSRVLFDITLATTVVGVEGKFTLRHQSTILLSTAVTAQLTGMWPHICSNGPKSETWQIQTLDSCGRSVTMYQESYSIRSAVLYCSWSINVLKPVIICRVLVKSKRHNYSLITINMLDIGDEEESP